MTELSLPEVAISFIPSLALFYIFFKWSLSMRTLAYAISRMSAQLIAIGFFLVYIFQIASVWIMICLFLFMLAVASWIALRPLQKRNKNNYKNAFISLCLGCLPVLGLLLFAVLKPSPWYDPRYSLPIAGMIFSSSMNSLSLAAERFNQEITQNKTYIQAREASFNASLLPAMNTLFAVGLVSLPGMMTGQILSGVSPIIAVRYQAMIMISLLSASGLSSAFYLLLIKKK